MLVTLGFFLNTDNIFNLPGFCPLRVLDNSLCPSEMSSKKQIDQNSRIIIVKRTVSRSITMHRSNCTLKEKTFNVFFLHHIPLPVGRGVGERGASFTLALHRTGKASMRCAERFSKSLTCVMTYHNIMLIIDYLIILFHVMKPSDRCFRTLYQHKYQATTARS